VLSKEEYNCSNVHMLFIDNYIVHGETNDTWDWLSGGIYRRCGYMTAKRQVRMQAKDENGSAYGHLR